ncbi:DUF4752 family protein, partial [Escherichia coli]|nr:DUF4752 family protein [Escherichia coli]MDA6418311.1 DUF4752 family protein [Escherichia coli]MDA6598388.1 DUF4752 family protein [Escherichia coli]MDA6879706.1 DUF4752 family protein [Escherichia coli]MDA6914063.1 DUF4752 family protein [Escherichia coli]
FCSLLAPSDAILFQEGVSVKLRLPQDSFYEAFNLNSLQPGYVIVVTTQSGMTIQIHKPKEEK